MRLFIRVVIETDEERSMAEPVETRRKREVGIDLTEKENRSKDGKDENEAKPRKDNVEIKVCRDED